LLKALPEYPDWAENQDGLWLKLPTHTPHNLEVKWPCKSTSGEASRLFVDRVKLLMQLFLMAVGALTAFALDQITKIVVVHYLALKSIHVIPVIPPYLVFVMGWNEGINFGMLSHYGKRWALVAFSLVVSLALAVWARTSRGWIMPLATGFVAGGALGNALDRVAYGAVVDFLNMSCCGITNPYSFNVADIFVFLGAGLLFIGLFDLN
jgi:signal peptidase II